MDPCATCGRCCRELLVPIFGLDLWRICRRRNKTPQSVASYVEQDQPDAFGFRFLVGARTYRLVLLKQEPIAETQPCVFLEEYGDGTSRCGIYDDRPMTCRVYPMFRIGPRVLQQEESLCPPDAWADLDELDLTWHQNMQHTRMERDIYAEVVARWNAWVDHTSPSAPLPPRLYGEYLLNVYDRLGELTESLGADALAEIVWHWARVASPTPSAASVSRAAEPVWLTHFRRARAIIDGFFSDVPPLPFQRMIVEVDATAR